jgi:hypothetical protein
MGDDHMLAIGAPEWPLEAALFESLHPDGDAIGIPIEDLNTIESLIEEHKQSSVAHIALEIALDDTKEPIEALAHVDGLGVQIDRHRRA